MNILAFDTASECCSVGLLYQGWLFASDKQVERGHADCIFTMMDDVLAQAEATVASIDAIAFGRGPGAFTGVRIGAAVAQGVAFACNLPVIAVSSLAAIAQSAADKLQVDYLAVAMDARMGEVYVCSYHYQDGLVNALEKEQVCPPDKFKPMANKKWTGVGNGWSIYDVALCAQFKGRLATVSQGHYPQAASIIKLAKTERPLPPEEAVPVYLRDNVATTKKGRF